MEQENTQNGTLFNSIVYKSSNEVDELIENLTSEQAFYMIIEAIQYSHKLGIFSLQEGELVSKSLRILHKEFGSK
jgi:hypothetical protein